MSKVKTQSEPEIDLLVREITELEKNIKWRKKRLEEITKSPIK